MKPPFQNLLSRFVTVVFLLAGWNASLWAATEVSCSFPNTEPAATEYFVSLADPQQHLAHVSIRFRAAANPITLNLPVWNALYQVRNFAAHVIDVRAVDAAGFRLPVFNAQTSEWRVVGSSSCVVVHYDIYLDSPGPFGSQLNGEHGFFNWAMVLMYSPALRAQPASLQLLDLPDKWGVRDLHVLKSSLSEHGRTASGTARNYDELSDSPAEAGVFQQYEFEEDGAKYRIVVHAYQDDYDPGKLQDVLRRITHAAVTWMQDRPYDEYTFLYHFPPGHGAGGMEHAYGTAIETNADRLRNSLMPVASVSAHEFFHLWNVKRIRPQSLEPIEYQHQMDTPALWFSEGVTSTVGDLLLARSGLIDERQYVDRISAEINELQGRPAHTWQSAEESSVNAWFEGDAFYRSPQRSVSYYNKGEILGVLLDLRIRQLTQDKKSLRDLFQWLNEKYARKGIFFPDSAGVQKAAEAVSGQDFGAFFSEYVGGVKELPYNEFFGFVGLQVAEATAHIATVGFEATANLGAQPEIVSVDPNSDAQRAGVRSGDRVVKVNGKPSDAFFQQEVARMRPGDTVKLRLASQGREREVKLKLGAREEHTYFLQDVPLVSPEQRAHRAAWIHGEDESDGSH